MRLARFRDSSGPGWGFVEPDGLHPTPAGAPSLLDVLAAGELPAWHRCRLDPVPLTSVTLLAPVPRPGKVVCVGLNYRAHAEESGLAIPAEPLLFMKYPSAITGPHAEIVLPPESSQVDWEVELAVVIGRRIDRIDRTARASALAAVAGFAVANDVSARDLQAKDGQWVRAKSFRSFCPLGPWITTADEVGDGSGLDITLWVNDRVKQHSNTSDLIADVADILVHTSQVGPLEPGDLILTGTPAGTGIGLHPPEFLAPGDVVKAAISGLGEIVNLVVAFSDHGEMP